MFPVEDIWSKSKEPYSTRLKPTPNGQSSKTPVYVKKIIINMSNALIHQEDIEINV